MFRRSPQLILENHLCALTSDAPVMLPRRLDSRLSSRRVTTSLHALYTQGEDASKQCSGQEPRSHSH